MSNWPPKFTLDQERVLHLLTGDRFYSNPSAALREAILNAIDAVNRRQGITFNLVKNIKVIFNRNDLILKVVDNGIGMNKDNISNFFSKIGASKTADETSNNSVGEFGIGIVSYFMAGETFELQTYDGETEPVGLVFDYKMLDGGVAQQIEATRQSQGTTLTIKIRDDNTFNILLDSFPHWCRDVEGLSGQLLPDGNNLIQGGKYQTEETLDFELPHWVERVHLGPVREPTGWYEMTGSSTIAVLYRGVFVQEFKIDQIWGIEGSIDVNPKHFKPRLNREGFIDGEFQQDVTNFLRSCHPIILEAMVQFLVEAKEKGMLTKWTQKQWASLWLSVPREAAYAKATKAWDLVFRSLPAFEIADKDKWKSASFEEIRIFKNEVFVAPLADEKADELVQAAVRFLRNTARPVIRGIRYDKSWIRDVPRSFNTTADLILHVFFEELPSLVVVRKNAENILERIETVAPLFNGPPSVDLVELGNDSIPALRVHGRLLINIDRDEGKSLVKDVLQLNTGPMCLIEAAARHTYQQLTQVAAVVREAKEDPEVLGIVRRQYIRSLLL